MSAFRTLSYGITHEGTLGFSSHHNEPHMSILINQRQTELWANNKNPYYASYAPNGVSIYSGDKVLPWKRREYTTTPPTFEGTRFRLSRGELDARATAHATLRASKETRQRQ